MSTINIIIYICHLLIILLNIVQTHIRYGFES